jgi:hypothetical protein
MHHLIRRLTAEDVGNVCRLTAHDLGKVAVPIKRAYLGLAEFARIVQPPVRVCEPLTSGLE